MATALREIILTGTTCGEACWHAYEDVCRCSCGGVNHGALRDDAGSTQPLRTCRIKGHMYTLAAAARDGIYTIERDWSAKARASGLCTMSTYSDGVAYLVHDIDGYPVITRVASEAQVARWPELASFRNGWRPRLVWVRTDVYNAA